MINSSLSHLSFARSGQFKMGVSTPDFGVEGQPCSPLSTDKADLGSTADFARTQFSFSRPSSFTLSVTSSRNSGGKFPDSSTFAVKGCSTRAKLSGLEWRVTHDWSRSPKLGWTYPLEKSREVEMIELERRGVPLQCPTNDQAQN